MAASRYQPGLFKDFQDLMLRHETSQEKLRQEKYENQLLQSKNNTLEKKARILAEQK